MKSIKQLAFIGLAITLVLTSCTMEKRVYMSGYHTDWYKSKHNPDKQELVNKQIVTVEQSENEINIADNSPKIIDDNFTASVDNSVIVSSHKTVSFSKKESKITTKTNPATETKTVISDKKALKNKLKELKANAPKHSGNDGNNGILALRILGWLIWACGILIILFASILGGLIICALGILFMVLGRKHKGSSSSNNDNKSEMQDVVYLKNGSVIKGMIIEQTPNVSIKIQTKDGSLFVYKMDEISKMTKEPSK